MNCVFLCVVNVLMKVMKIVFLGCGIMGVFMVKNLLNVGYEVIVWNCMSVVMVLVVEVGVCEVKSVSEVCVVVEVMFVMVSTSEAALAVARVVKDGLSVGKGYVDVFMVDVKMLSEIVVIV